MLTTQENNSVLLSVKKLLNEFIFEQLEIVLDLADVALNTFKYIAFIGVLIKIFYNLHQNYTNWWGYVSWLPLTFLLFNYDGFVVALFDWGKSLDNHIAIYQNFSKIKEFFAPTEIDFENTSIFKIGTSMFMDLIRRSIVAGIVSVLLILSFVVSSLIYMYLKVKMFFKLFILVIFGPLNISLSYLDEFKGNYVAWITKLIEVCTYIPIIYFIDYMGVEMLNKCFAPSTISKDTSLLSTLTIQILGIVFFIITILMYVSVPSLVKYVIMQGTNAIGTSKKVGGIAVVAVRKLITKGA